MINRRRVLALSAAAAAAAVAQPSLGAKGHSLDVTLPNPWEQTPAQLARHRLHFNNLDVESVQDFTRGVAKFLTRAAASSEGTGSREAFLRSKGLSTLDDTDLPAETCYALMLEDPQYAAELRLSHSNVHLHLDNPRRHFNKNIDYYLSEMTKTETSGPGSLELNPGLDVPAHLRHEIHSMPGGHPGDTFAGWVHDYGHIAGTDDLWDHGRYVNFARTQKKPSDGQVSRILDVGCGVGYSTQILKARFPNAEVWGIDAGTPMVRYAHYRAVKRNSQVHFSHRLAENTKFPDGHFDIVTDASLFHETSEPSQTKIMAEMYRILRPGGVFNHIDTPTKGLHRDEMPTTVPAKAAMYMQYRDNLEVWWIEYLKSDLPANMAAAGFKVDLVRVGQR